MATYDRFEDLPVWQKSADFAAKIFEWSQHPELQGRGDLRSQLKRATLSISNNIAEGFERGTTNELLHFLYIARGSAGEVRSMFCVMERMNDFDNLKSEISDLKSTCENISRQIRGWADSLQNSDIKGQRHLNDHSRQKYERKQKQNEFREQQERFRKELEEKQKRKLEQKRQTRES